MYIRLLMYPVQMPSLMHLIFAKKQKTFFGLPVGRVWQNCFTLHDRFRFCKSLSPLFPGFSSKPVPAETAKPDFYFKLLGALLCCLYQQYYPPQIKCISFAVRIKFCFHCSLSRRDGQNSMAHQYCRAQ